MLLNPKEKSSNLINRVSAFMDTHSVHAHVRTGQSGYMWSNPGSPQVWECFALEGIEAMSEDVTGHHNKRRIQQGRFQSETLLSTLRCPDSFHHSLGPKGQDSADADQVCPRPGEWGRGGNEEEMKLFILWTPLSRFFCLCAGIHKNLTRPY